MPKQPELKKGESYRLGYQQGLKEKITEKDDHYIGLLEFMAEQMVNLSNSLANINKNLEKIADGEKSLYIQQMKKKIMEYGTAKEI